MKRIGMAALAATLVAVIWTAPVPARAQNQQSQQAGAWQAGDTVVATRSTALKVGWDDVARVSPGQELRVLTTRDGWIGASVQQNGQQVRGWLWGEFAAHPGQASAPAVSGYRSFSYQPADATAGAALPQGNFAPSGGYVRSGYGGGYVGGNTSGFYSGGSRSPSPSYGYSGPGGRANRPPQPVYTLPRIDRAKNGPY